MTDHANLRTLDRPGDPQEVEDDVLAAMVAELPDDDTLEIVRGDSNDVPFNVGLPAPRAIDLRTLWKLAGKTPDPMITAALGARVPILLSHGVTALPRPGRKPARVWGLGYKVEMFDVAADTIGIQPATELLDIATVGSQVTLAIGLDGSLEVPAQAVQALDAVPGVSLTEAKVSAGLKEDAKLSISFTLSVPKVISGPGDGHGGADWSLYAQDKRLEGHQALLQTVLLPKGVHHLRLGITGWAREAGLFGPKQWIFETATFEVDLQR
jgi:hypothetical protein